MSAGSYPDGVTDADIEREMAAPAQRCCGTCAKWVESPVMDGVGVCGASWADPGQVEALSASGAAGRATSDDGGWDCADWEEWS